MTCVGQFIATELLKLTVQSTVYGNTDICMTKLDQDISENLFYISETMYEWLKVVNKLIRIKQLSRFKLRIKFDLQMVGYTTAQPFTVRKGAKGVFFKCL